MKRHREARRAPEEDCDVNSMTVGLVDLVAAVVVDCWGLVVQLSVAWAVSIDLSLVQKEKLSAAFVLVLRDH